MSARNLRVGAVVWAFGRGDRPTITPVTSDTPRLWVLKDGQKVPKNHAADVYDARGTMHTARYCLTKEAADAMLLQRMRWTMSNAVTNCNDAATLRAVAAALGLPIGVEEP